MSENEGKLRAAFAHALRLPADQVTEEISYDSTPGWDSVAHLALIGALDETFGIMMENSKEYATSDAKTETHES